MSRITFRVWDKKANKYAVISKVLELINKSSKHIAIFEDDDHIIEPFTEKYDKTGRGIFVGDIVKKTWLTGWVLGPYTGEVVKDGDCYHIKYIDERHPNGDAQFTSLAPYSYQQYDAHFKEEREDYEYEIVGNVHYLKENA